MQNTQRKALISALEFYVDCGVDEALTNSPQDRTKIPPPATSMLMPSKHTPQAGQGVPSAAQAAASAPPAQAVLGKSDAQIQAATLAAQANTLEELEEAIKSFDGLAIRKTATNMVFSDGNPKADIMLIGEAPGADEDRQGKPFVGVSGQLLDKILKFIDVERAEDAPEKGLYISNILNWRPPGNRTPSPAEVAVSLPFIEKHIILAQPKILILCGGISAKALLGRTESISRLRKTWHDYTPQTKKLGYSGPAIPAIATYHPAYLLRTPAQKKAVWRDMLAVKGKRNELYSK